MTFKITSEKKQKKHIIYNKGVEKSAGGCYLKSKTVFLQYYCALILKKQLWRAVRF